MRANGNIKKLIAEGRLPDAFARFESFVRQCEEARAELTQSQNRFSSLQAQIRAHTTGDEAYVELNRITFSFLQQIEKFHNEVLSSYFEVADKKQYLSEIASRDQLIRETLELRLQPKQYRLEEQMGEGSSSVIYRLLNPFTNRHAICMVLKVSVLEPPLKRQILQLAGLRHRNVIKLIDCELDSYPYFIIMEYIHGPTLTSAVETTGPRPAAQVVDWLYQLADAVEYMRHKRLLPNNLRPSKIFVDDEWQIMISPFDLHMASTGAFTFKRYLDVCRYGSPELLQADGASMDIADVGLSDQYSIGLIAYKMLSGEDLFEGDSMYDILESRRKFSSDEAYRTARLAEMPAETFTWSNGSAGALADIIRRLLNEQPGGRYARLRDLLHALHPFTRADMAGLSLSRQSYRRCIALNKEFIRDFYQAFHRNAPETEKEFDPVSRNRQSAMLQMSIDILLDLDQKSGLLLSLANNARHIKYDFSYFEVFLDTLLETLRNNDPQWNKATAAEWKKIRDKALALIDGEIAARPPET
jgi:serine/threonine protein kinase